MKKSQIDKFEEQLRKHCNIEGGIDGDDTVRSSVNSVLIAFEEWYKEYYNKSIFKLKKISSKNLPPEYNDIINDKFWDLF